MEFKEKPREMYKVKLNWRKGRPKLFRAGDCFYLHVDSTLSDNLKKKSLFTDLIHLT